MINSERPWTQHCPQALTKHLNLLEKRTNEGSGLGVARVYSRPSFF
jgi:hypothetical protein